MKVVIDNGSGFCFGVKRAIATLEDELQKNSPVYCVGDIVHNEREIERLQSKGLKIIETGDLATLHNSAVLFRAHGEPPSSYAYVTRNNLNLTDATCPVVLKLQERIRDAWQKMQTIGGQIVLFGKKGHAEVIGLMGQTDNKCILLENESQVELVDPAKPTEVFAQTTKDPQQYESLIAKIRERVNQPVTAHNTICRQMADRAEHLKSFASSHDMILFVGGAKSSNSKVLYEISRSINANSHFVTSEDEVSTIMDTVASIGHEASIGIFGATSTPLWLMEQVKVAVESWVESHIENKK